VLVTHLHSDHVGGLTSKNGARAFPNAEVWVAKAENDFWLSKEAEAKAPLAAKEFFDAAQAIAAPYIKAGKWHTFRPADTIVASLEIVPLGGHTPGHTGYEFTSEGHKILFSGDLLHSIPAQLWFPDVTTVFDVDESADIKMRDQELQAYANQDVIIAGAHFAFPSMGRIYKVAGVYQWNPVAPSNRWEDR
jgi:glyoxylase-like metal-dependent hydrolase (beta-lactamase superfamily II)